MKTNKIQRKIKSTYLKEYLMLTLKAGLIFIFLSLAFTLLGIDFTGEE